MPPDGSAILLPPDMLRQEMLMIGQLPMFDLTTCGLIVNATSSPGLPDGPMRYVSRDA